MIQGKTFQKALILVLLAAASAAPSRGLADEAPRAESPLSLASVQIGFIGVRQGDGNSSSAVVDYAPRYRVLPQLAVGLDLGLAYLKLSDASRFAALEYLAAADFAFLESWTVGLRAGAQTFTCSGCKTAFQAGPQLTYQLPALPVPWVKNVWASYLPAFFSTRADEFRAGVGLSF